MTTIGIVSPGAMGSALARVLRGGSRVVATVRAGALGLRAWPRGSSSAGARRRPGSVGLVLSVVPPGEARAVAEAIAAAAAATGATPLVADLNAVAPATMLDIARRLETAG